jgi:hypothetical protein
MTTVRAAKGGSGEVEIETLLGEALEGGEGAVSKTDSCRFSTV